MEPLTADDPAWVGGFRLKARLGAGGMGQVYLGTSAGGRTVAVKVVRAELARDAEFIRRFRHEVTAARRVSGAFTAPVVAADPDANPPWLATAFVPGPSLQDWVDTSGPLPELAVRRLAAGLAEALSAVHACGLVHRDLKPSNVLLARDGPRLIDFGISRTSYNTTVTIPGLVMGTPPFMSPEQARGNPVGPASDIFSLGAVLCLAATGRPPFGAGNSPVVLYRIAYEPPAIDTISAPLRDIIGRCLAKDPAGRPRPAGLMRALADGMAESGVAPGSFWPSEVAQRVKDFDARLDEGLPEPVFVANAVPSAPAAHAVPRAPRTAAGIGPLRGRRGLLVGGGIAVVLVGSFLAVLWPGSAQRPGADGAGQRPSASTTRDPAPRSQPTPTRRLTLARKPTRQVTSPSASTTLPVDPVSRCSGNCVALYNRVYVTSDVLAVVGADVATGEPVDLQSASSSNQAEDWAVGNSATVSTYYASGMVSAAFSQQYGSDDAYELQYDPFGKPTDECLGVPGTARQGSPVTLQPCGASAATLWVSDIGDEYAGWFPLISATDTDFSRPLVLTADAARADATTSSLTGASGQFWSTEH